MIGTRSRSAFAERTRIRTQTTWFWDPRSLLIAPGAFRAFLVLLMETLGSSAEVRFGRRAIPKSQNPDLSVASSWGVVARRGSGGASLLPSCSQCMT